MMDKTIRKFEYLNGYTSLHAYYLSTKANRYFKYSKKENDEDLKNLFEQIGNEYTEKANDVEKEYKSKQKVLTK